MVEYGARSPGFLSVEVPRIGDGRKTMMTSSRASPVADMRDPHVSGWREKKEARGWLVFAGCCARADAGLE